MGVVTFLALSVNLVGGGVLWYRYLYGFYIRVFCYMVLFLMCLHCRRVGRGQKETGPPVCLGDPDLGVGIEPIGLVPGISLVWILWVRTYA